MGMGMGEGGDGGGGELSGAGLFLCSPLPPLAPPHVCQNGLLPAKHAFTAREGLFFC